MKKSHFALIIAVALSPIQLFAQQAQQATDAVDKAPEAVSDAAGEVVEEVVVEEVVAADDTVERVVADAIIVEEVDPATGKVEQKIIEEEVVEEVMTEPSDLSSGGLFSEPLPSQSDFIPDDSLLMEPVVPMYGDDADFEDVGDVQAEGPEPGAELRERVGMRKARNKASRNEEVMEALAMANAEVFHEEKRLAMREYYKKLYSRMRRIDGSLKERIDAAEEEQLGILRESHRGLNDVVEPGSDVDMPSDEPAADDATVAAAAAE